VLFCDGAAKDELKCRLSKCDTQNQQLEMKLQCETNKVELLQADLAQIKTVFYVTCILSAPKLTLTVTSFVHWISKKIHL